MSGSEILFTVVYKLSIYKTVAVETMTQHSICPTISKHHANHNMDIKVAHSDYLFKLLRKWYSKIYKMPFIRDLKGDLSTHKMSQSRPIFLYKTIAFSTNCV